MNVKCFYFNYIVACAVYKEELYVSENNSDLGDMEIKNPDGDITGISYDETLFVKDYGGRYMRTLHEYEFEVMEIIDRNSSVSDHGMRLSWENELQKIRELRAIIRRIRLESSDICA